MVRPIPAALVTLLLAASVSLAQAPTSPVPATPSAPPVAATAATPATPPSPVSSIRNKISAGDLLSAESILEVYRLKYSEDSAWLSGLGWLSRGALMLGEPEKARRYAAAVRNRCREQIKNGADLTRDHSLEIALGAAIEVEAQLMERSRGKRHAVAFLENELKGIPAPPSLRSRLHKRIAMMSLDGTAAPELEIEDTIGEARPTLSSLRGKPVVLFLWAEWCGDCRSQATALAKARARFASKNVQVIAVTRYYDEPEKRLIEKARVDSVWRADYSELAGVPVVFSSASMERYGGSSTPTFVFVDTSGVVKSYTPTRLAYTELESRIAAALR